jgi:hypothetical protein
MFVGENNMIKNKSSSEHLEQIGFVDWFRRKFPNILIFAIPNGGVRDIGTAIKLKDEGVVRGIPDLMIPAFKIFIEFKRKKGGVVSKDQEHIIEYLQRHGYTVYICYGAEDASRRVLDFWKEINEKK